MVFVMYKHRLHVLGSLGMSCLPALYSVQPPCCIWHFVRCRQFVVQRTADIEPSCACAVCNLTTVTVQFLIIVALTAVILLLWIYCQSRTIQLTFVV